MDTGKTITKLLRYVTVRPLIFFFILFFIFSCTSPSSKEEKRTYKVGFMICNSEQETLHRFQPFTAYLSKKLGVPFEAMAIDTSDFTRHVAELDFTHTNSLLYIIMNRNHGVEILAAEKSGSLGARTKGLIITSRTSGIQNVRELKGKSMIFGPMLGPTSYMAQLDMMLRDGIDPDNDLAYYAIPDGSFKHEKVIYGVFFGKFDAGAVPLLDFERMADDGRINREDFTIIAEGPTMPYCSFGVTQKVEGRLAKRFKEVLLNITKNDTVQFEGQKIKVLERANIDGYVDIGDEDFDEVREMAKRTNMPPYQKY